MNERISVMYGLPSDFNPQTIVGRYLAKISFGKGSMHLDLERNLAMGKSDLLSLVIVGRYSYVISGEAYEGNGAEPSSGVKLVALLNKDVTEANVIGRGDLLIGFGLDNRLHVREDDSGFESYTMYFPGEQEIVV